MLIHRVIAAITMGLYLAIMSLMCLAMLIGPLLVTAALVIIGCVAMFIQRINFYWILCKYRIGRWWWFKKKNFQ